MPPKRRTTAQRTASNPRQQSTLSFNGKNSRVTKSSQQQSPNEKSLDKKKEALFDEAVSTAEVAEPTTAEKAIEQQTAAETQALDDAKAENELTGGSTTEDVLGGRAQTSDAGAVGGLSGSGWVGDEEARARKVSEAQIKKFWREKESARLVPRVHQEDLSVHEKVLREWDVSGEYGVSLTLHLKNGRGKNADHQNLALYRHCKTEALEACECPWPEAANRGSGCPAQGDG